LFGKREINNEYDIKELKRQLSNDDIVKLVEYLGGKLYERNDTYLRFDSICYHRDCTGHKGKMYYYGEYFVDYKLGESFDVFEMVKKRYELLGKSVTFVECVGIVGDVCNLKFKIKNTYGYDYLKDLGGYLRGHNTVDKTLNTYNESILNNFENVYHMSWIDDGITVESMHKYGIKYYSWENQIVIPCHDIGGNLIGIRVRNVDESKNWKYRPLIMFDGTEFNFPTRKALYGLNLNKYAIEKYGKAILFESEKSVLQCDGWWGEKNIAVGMFGSAMTKEKRDLLLSTGLNELVIAIDFDYETVDSEEFKKFKEKIKNIAEFFEGFCKVSYLVEYGEHPLKCSPSDRGEEKFMELYRKREIYED
jgi:hypothetical protein